MKTIALGTLALSAALLGGCALPNPPARFEPYDLGLLPAAADAPAAVSTLTAPLIWDGVSAPQAIDGTAIIYRLLYAQGGQQPRPYAGARWAQAPAQLLGQRLRAALAATRPVVDADMGLTAPELRIELDDFSQVFESPQQSLGVVRLRATLLAHSAPLLAQRSFAARIPASSNDAPGGALALKAAADQVIGEVVAWVNGGR